MSYKVKQSTNGYDILEKETDVIINLKYGEKKVRDLCRKMNLGAGFNGFTPDFFANLKGRPMSE
jgi:hypothetical protein